MGLQLREEGLVPVRGVLGGEVDPGDLQEDGGEAVPPHRAPCPDNRIEVFSDGNTDYGHVLPEYYVEPCIDYGQLIKIREGGRVVDKKKRVVMGSPELRDIETTNVENFNGILRERLGRLVRKTKCYSKKRRRLENALELIQFHWNTMHVIKGSSTPGMIESLTDHVWDWDDFLMYHYAV